MSDPFNSRDTMFDDAQLRLPELEPSYNKVDDFTDLQTGRPLNVVEQPTINLPPIPAPIPPPPVPAQSRTGPSMSSGATSGFLLAPEFTAPSSASMAIPIVGALALAVIGGAYAGIWGAATGAAGSGAVVNLARYLSNRSKDPAKARVHAVFAVVSAGAAVYTGRRAYLRKRTAVAQNRMEMPPWLNK